MNNDHNNNKAEIQSSEQQLNTNTKVVGDGASTNNNKQRTNVAASKQIRRHRCRSRTQSHQKQYRSNNICVEEKLMIRLFKSKSHERKFDFSRYQN